MTDVEIVGNAVTGTLPYVTGYTGFSEDAAEQEGNYLALRIESYGDEVTATYDGATATIDEDEILIVRVTAAGGDLVLTSASGSVTLDLSGLELEEE